MALKETIKELPDSPGVYLMKDKTGGIIYIGKASSLKKRVSSYFYASRKLSPKLDKLVSYISDIEVIRTGSEAEALLFEASLIKEHRPRYNAALKDDKSYPLIKITTNERLPRIFVTRGKRDDGAKYYGPWTDAKLLKKAVKMLRKVFPIRACPSICKTACLYYHIGLCAGPCVGKISEENYNEIVRHACLFLEGKKEELLKYLFKKMNSMASQLEYEKAARIRDQIKALTTIVTRAQRYRAIDETEELKVVLSLPRAPRRIEAFDISDIYGKEAVGSMVTFLNGKPDRGRYRKFKIKWVEGIDDYAMMKEVVHRRYKRILVGQTSRLSIEEGTELPDLIIIDGGKGHLSSACEELNKLNLKTVPVIGIAKGHETIFLKDKPSPIILPPNSRVLHLIMRIRDEAHRFAITYHRGLRSKIPMES
ncbi:MAG: excinuclease ABC subunit UvrC, partial [Candidatus Omnitrophica bacterium]|nr:excinuclease ABC subunit UvrC [Candidatus Omnitrophota bacterium]